MAHEQLPPEPIVSLPREVAQALIDAGQAEPSPSPLESFAASDWTASFLLVTGGVASAITIVKAIPDGLHALARQLDRWHRKHPPETDEEGRPKQRLIWFQASKGSGKLDLNESPTEEQLEAFLLFAWLLLLDDVKRRS